MGELSIIKEQEVLGKNFRVYGTPEQPLFMARDVAEWIEYDVKNAYRLYEEVEEDERITCSTFFGGQVREMKFLTEDGLYEVLMMSRKPIAKEFKKKVKEILKTIRRHGMYAVDDLLDDPDLAIKAFTALKEEREKRRALEAENESMKPKAIFADAVAASKESILIGNLAKLISQNGVPIGQNRLFTWMYDNGYLIKNGDRRRMPTQKAMELGLFEVKERAIDNPDGSVRLTRTTLVTGKGQQYFINKFLGKDRAVG
ncbi:phage antirepressor [Enterocloster citroniae]|uniref:phage antirepressor n=1 Tax=Enterocloster citroniae TaxID=358743 RepID=UPI002E798A61|nr:phage antirepressor KilAC domain-containing protein [Enterocloster citroniae]